MRTTTTVLAAFLLRPVSFVRRWIVIPWMVAAAGCPGALPDVVVESTDGGSSSATGEDPDTTGATLDATIGDTETTDVGDTDAEPGCGNGIVEAGETCDDEGESATCDEDCTPVDCGDGLLNEAAGEECDEGGPSKTCNLDCTPPRCGDGVVNVEGEQCDDGWESVFCDGDCTVAECGDGVLNVTAAEQCDDAGESARCDEDCTAAECGDGSLNVVAGEICDVDDLAGGTCEGLGFGMGMLACGAECAAYETSGCTPSIPVLELSFSQVKQFDFSWAAAVGAEHYQVLESAAPGEPYVQLGGDVVGESASFEMPLHFRWEASYVLRACNLAGCTDSAVVDVVGSLAEAVGYFKPSNTGLSDYFGFEVALSDDGNTVAVGAIWEDSASYDVNGDSTNNLAEDAGAVYVFARDPMDQWAQQAYIKASNTGAGDYFGIDVTLSSDGNTLAVGALYEDTDATGIDDSQANESAPDAGAVYVFVRDGLGQWSQQAYLKASNTDPGDLFGAGVTLSGDGNALAVGARHEASSAIGVDANQYDNAAPQSGAAYVFVRDGTGQWTQQAYLKASTVDPDDIFGTIIALSGDGMTLAVGALYEDSSAMGIDGYEADDSAPSAGAVYVFVNDGMGQWSQQAYIKASNTDSLDVFGHSVALSDDGSTLAVGGPYEDGDGIDADQTDNSMNEAGAVYIFVRDAIDGWSQQAYLKASNPGQGDLFGIRVALDDGGDILAVGAHEEDSNATSIDGDQADDSAPSAGAVYVFARDGMDQWSQRAYVKASNTGSIDRFGHGVALSSDGETLAVGAREESSDATGISGDQHNELAPNSGAVYLY